MAKLGTHCTRVSTIVAIVLCVLFATAQAAFAIQIDKPVPNGGPISACTDGNPNVTRNNSGTYCKASGGPTPYTWTITPTGAGTVQVVPGTGGTVARFIAHKVYAEQNNYASFTLTAIDANGTPSLPVTVNPITLIWVEPGTFAPLTGSKDRVVHHKDSWNSVERTREVGLECRGQVPIFKVFAHAYAVTGGPGGMTGAGRIDVLEFDNDPNAVQGSGCTPPPGVIAPFGKWKLVPTGGVTSSWNPTPPPNTAKGTVHTLTIRGDVTSAFQDDIEWDVGIETGPGLHNCADGIGCVMLYTVVKVDLTIGALTDTTEKEPGQYLAYEKNAQPANGQRVTEQRVLPDNFSGYDLEIESVDPQDNAKNGVIDINDTNNQAWGAPKIRQVNSELTYAPWVMPVSKSADARDVRARIKLRGNNKEVGDETCRDFVAFTVVEVDVTNPVKQADGNITTPANAVTDDGNEFTFSNASTGVLDIEWRMNVLPDTASVRTDLTGKMSWSILQGVGDSTLSWPNGQSMTYDTDHWEALARFTTLPTQNDGFGQKTCELNITQNVRISWLQRPIETFYNRDATNHPGGVAGNPNWFYYWRQVYGSGSVTYDGSWSGYMKTPGMLDWSYTTAQSKTAIVVGSQMPAAFSSYGVGEFFSGIDCFVSSIIHEEKHVARIALADALVPVASGTCFRYGWSYNSPTTVNHWSKGPDGKWGVADTDDDGNGTKDDAAPTPPFEPGNGDDVRLSGTGRLWYWATTWSLPSPDNASWPEESEAINAQDAAVNEHDYAGQDWGNPGKRHATTNNWAD